MSTMLKLIPLLAGHAAGAVWRYDTVTVASSAVPGVSDVQYNVAVAGNSAANNTFLMLHGFPETAASWMWSVLPEFETQFGQDNFQLIAPDLHGINFTDPKPEDVAFYKMENMVDELKTLVQQHYKLDKVWLVGHDFGANLGWHVYYMAPEMLLGYVSLAIPPLKYVGLVEGTDNDPVWNAAGDYRTAWLNNADFWAFAWLKNLTITPLGVKGHILERDAAWQHQDSLKYHTRWYEAGAAPSKTLMDAIADSVNKIMPPSGYIAGRKDSIIPVEHRVCCDDSLFDDTYFQFAETTHWIQYEDPEAVVTFVKNFISGDETLQKLPDFCAAQAANMTEHCPANLTESPLPHQETIYEMCKEKCPAATRAVLDCLINNITANCVTDYCEEEDEYNTCINQHHECKYLQDTPLRQYTHETLCALSKEDLKAVEEAAAEGNNPSSSTTTSTPPPVISGTATATYAGFLMAVALCL